MTTLSVALLLILSASVYGQQQYQPTNAALNQAPGMMPPGFNVNPAAAVPALPMPIRQMEGGSDGRVYSYITKAPRAQPMSDQNAATGPAPGYGQQSQQNQATAQNYGQQQQQAPAHGPAPGYGQQQAPAPAPRPMTPQQAPASGYGQHQQAPAPAFVPMQPAPGPVSGYGQHNQQAPAPAFVPMAPAPAPVSAGGYGQQAPAPSARPMQPTSMYGALPMMPKPHGYGPSGMKPPGGHKMLTASEGTCGVLDTVMWQQVPNAAVVGAIMFDRQSGLSCAECLENCVTQAAGEKWSCQSLTYDHRHEVCDLFAVVPVMMSGHAAGAPGIRPSTPAGQSGGYHGDATVSMMSNGGYASSAVMSSYGGSHMSSTGTGYAVRIKRSAYGGSSGGHQPAGHETSDAHLVPYPGRDYFRLVTGPTTAAPITDSPTDATTNAVTDAPVTGESSCGDGQVPIYWRAEGYAPNAPGSPTISDATSESDCVSECSAGIVLPGCNAANWYDDSTCDLYITDNILDIGTNVDANEGIWLYQSCVPSSFGSENQITELRPNEVLVGQIDLIDRDSATLEDCIALCASTTEIECVAGNFFPDFTPPHCSLYTVARFEKPEYQFGEEEVAGPTTYFGITARELQRRFRATQRSRATGRFTRGQANEAFDKAFGRHHAVNDLFEYDN